MTSTGAMARRPKRADARRNYAKLIEAARAVFTESGTDASLEEIARRAEVGIGTLYRNFPTRQNLLEATYLEEVQALCDSAEDLALLEPWEALSGWLRRFAVYSSTKKALAGALVATLDTNSDLFATSHAAIFSVGEPLLARAQQAGVVRTDVTFGDAVRIVSGIAMLQTPDSDAIQHLLGVTLDGLRYRAPARP